MTVFVADERDGGDDPPDTGQRPAVELDRLRGLARFVAADRGVPEDMELAVLCVPAAAMTELNRRHMGGDGPTDVLAFPIDAPDEGSDEAPMMLGDVVLCPDVAAAQAAAGGHGVQDELELLLVHGILHLLGHDHADDEERREMFALTDRLLAGWRAEAASGR